ncbi:hypothetical protein ACQP2P_05055 [Dactylosporangium sp. CA-139114]|uniref:hypothetical protein n=1 Tax=Dactylosporangium sp. CA-139114 TaxID=3239931 RepID=UPI003D995CF6
MTDQYYGYVKYTLPPSVSQYDNYSASNQIVDYDPTDWDAESTTIEMMWPWIQIDSDARATALADMWRRVHTLLDNTSRNLRRYTDELASHWNSDASKVFLREIGASLSSIDEWKDVANTNATGLDVLASTIKYNQKKALAVWNEYCQAINNPGSVPGSAPTSRIVAAGKGGAISNTETDDNRKKRLVKHYTEQIKPFVKDLADTYLNVYYNFLTHGSTYKGPTNAAVAVQPKFHGGGPGGSLPPPPILNPPSIPKTSPPDTSRLQSQLAGLGVPGYDPDHALTLAGGAVAPPLPPLPDMHLPPAPGGPGVVPSMNVPGLPAFPGGPNLRTARGLAGLDPAEAAQRLGQGPGQGPGGMRPQLPGRPNLSGLRPPPGGGARPPMPPGRGNPNLRGSKGRLPGGVHGPDLSEETGRGAPRSPMPPRLGGRRGPGGPSGHIGPEHERLGGRGNGLPPGQRGAGRAGAPGERLNGRRAPGLPLEEQEGFNRQAARPAIEGRGGIKRPAGSPLPEGEGRGPALRGRGGSGPGESPFRPVRRDQRAEHDDYAEATEDELWAVERPNQGGAVIDTPNLPQSPEAGPAIGRS